MNAAPTRLPRSPRSILVGLVGQGVGPSLTPPMHELEGARHGMSYVYRTIDIDPAHAAPEHLRPLLRSARALGFDGLNVTHPAKQAIVPLLDELAPGAARVGAVNTVRFAGERMIGHNTDVTGFGSAFDAAFGDEEHGLVVLVGAGGAGSAVATALDERRIADLVIADVDAGRAEALARQLGPRAGGSVRGAGSAELPRLLAAASGVVNATPFGMAAHPGMAFDPARLPADAWVADIVYRPTDTALLIAARACGLRTMSGLGMAMGQAADAFEIFTGVRADRAAMTRDLQDLVAAEAASPA
ncbi:shikimate dehydrogenase [Microbacterium karelineae]|uniref:shikimate dehydrogenase n=1 Tax=Microbacterium karelineae TaxID=2654283 RepID=UPI001E2DA553|nr:shikimate dehydrogenase [Microbacterium karelineae]